MSMAVEFDTREALARVRTLFPGEETTLTRQFLRDETFRSICEDYCLAHASLAEFKKRPDAAGRAEISEYRAILSELETEIRRALDEAD
ncbi:hypothetical protein KHP62_13425 [Rhodobacteraceae bacterium NNCM2]|nr:hypothetical protein [Coraliihabitans acroporae]